MKKVLCILMVCLSMFIATSAQTSSSLFHQKGEKVMSDTCGVMDYVNMTLFGTRNYDGIHSVGLDGKVKGFIPKEYSAALLTLTSIGPLSAGIYTTNAVKGIEMLKVSESTILRVLQEGKIIEHSSVLGKVNVTKHICRDYTIIVNQKTGQIMSICKTIIK